MHCNPQYLDYFDSFIFVQAFTDTLYSSFHVNINAFKCKDWSVIWDSDTAHLSQDRTKLDYYSRKKYSQPPSQSWTSPITQTTISATEDQTAVSQSNSSHSQPVTWCQWRQPSPDVPLPYPSHLISTLHLSSAQQQLVFILCPLQNSVPALNLSYSLCADPAKIAKAFFRF